MSGCLAKAMAKKTYTHEDRRANCRSRWARLRRTARILPYVVLAPGPSLEPCPIHTGAFDWVYRIDSPYWIDHPLCEHDKCQCAVRVVGVGEFELIQQEGLPDYPGTPVTNGGIPTGHVTYRKVPLRGIR